MVRELERTHEVGKEGLPEGQESYIEENITNDKEVNIGVKLSRYQYREASSPEGSELAMSEQEVFDLFDTLSDDEQDKIICLVAFLASQTPQNPSAQDSIG